MVNLTQGVGGQWIPPIGFVWLSTENVSPEIYFENTTWELISQNRVLMGAGDGHNGGDTVEAGLPNITGNIYDNWQGGSPSAGGAFRSSYRGSGQFKTGSDYYGHYGEFTFNASRSSSIYGNSTTVQPPAFYVYMWRRAS